MVRNAEKLNAWVVGDGRLAAELPELLGGMFNRVACTTVRQPEADTWQSLANREAETVAGQLSGFDVLLFADAPGIGGGLMETGSESIVDSVTNGMLPLFAFVKAAVQYFSKNKRQGSVIALCDIAGVGGRHDLVSTAGTSGAIIGFCKSLAKEMGRYSISVNVVCHGLVEGIPANTCLSESERQLFEASGLGKPVSPASLAGSVRYLSELGPDITGQVLRVDGGLLI